MPIQEELAVFNNDLALLASKKGIGRNFWGTPESLHIEAATPSQSVKLQEVFAVQSLFMAVRQEGWRFFTVARTKVAYNMPHFGDINWVEIMEPATTLEDKSTPSLRAVSFYVDDLSVTHKILNNCNLQPQPADDGVSIKLRGSDRSVIFTDVGISYSIEEQVKSRGAIPVTLE